MDEKCKLLSEPQFLGSCCFVNVFPFCHFKSQSKMEKLTVTCCRCSLSHVKKCHLHVLSPLFLPIFFLILLFLFSCQVDIFQKDLLLIPIHLEVHWSLVSVDIPRRSITYFDSQRTLNRRCPKVGLHSNTEPLHWWISFCDCNFQWIYFLVLVGFQQGGCDPQGSPQNYCRGADNLLFDILEV